jgi:hypothetical protein
VVALGGADRARGLALDDQACNARKPGACMALAFATTDPAQKQSALQRYEAIIEGFCNQGIKEACAEVSADYETGLGVARDPQKQREYTEKFLQLSGVK